MKKIILIMLILFPILSHANCNVYIPEKEYLHAGLTISFDFTRMLNDKGYTEVFSVDEDHVYEIHIKGEEPTRNHFNFAEASMMLVIPGESEQIFKNSVRCLTQFCGISDFGKSFRKAYSKLAKGLPVCQI